MQRSEFPENRIDLWIIKTSSTRLPLARLSSFLDETETVRLNRYANQQIARNFICSRGCLRLLLASYCSIAPSQARLQNLEHGKPSAPDFPGLCFNVSHSGELLLIGFSDRTIGVDVEKTRENVDFTGIIKRFFSESEAESWMQFRQASPIDAFFRGWTRKEAWLKATGEGVAGLGKCEVSFNTDNSTALMTMNGDRSEAARWFSRLILPQSGYVAAVVALKPEVELKIMHFEEHWSQFLSE